MSKDLSAPTVAETAASDSTSAASVESTVAPVTTDPATSAAGTDTPAAGTETPAAGTDTPAAGTDTPAAGTDTSATGAETPAATGLADGPVTYIALGDSLTAGDGDENYQGYVGLIGAAIGAARGVDNVSVANFGASGWDSTMMVDGQDGAPAQLGQAVTEAQNAVANGAAVLATVLIGSNDMWYLYEYGPPEGTPAANEDAAIEIYRANLDRTVTELIDAGAVVVIGLPDDQSLRPSVRDIDRLHDFLSDVTEEEVRQMAVVSARLDRVTQEIADAHGVRTIDTNAPFWADTAKMADDGIHPNAAGYADFAELWLAAIRELL
jgi:lysophospholipase L1-like esterase